MEELVEICDVRGDTKDDEEITEIVVGELVVGKVVDTVAAPVLELLMVGIGLRDTAVDVCMVGTGRDTAVLGPVVGGIGSRLHLCVLWQLVL